MVLPRRMIPWPSRPAPRPSPMPALQRPPPRNNGGFFENSKAAGKTGGFVFCLGLPRLGGLETQRHTVHAITQARGPRAVLEDMAEMAAATHAMHFGALHIERAVVAGENGVRQGFPETGPAGVTVIFGVRGIDR